MAVTKDGVDMLTAYPRELRSLGPGTDVLLKETRKTTKTGTSPITRKSYSTPSTTSPIPSRNLLCFWAVRELGLPLTALARQPGLSPPGVSYAVQRGEATVRENHYELVR